MTGALVLVGQFLVVATVCAAGAAFVVAANALTWYIHDRLFGGSCEMTEPQNVVARSDFRPYVEGDCVVVSGAFGRVDVGQLTRTARDARVRKQFQVMR